MPLRLLNYIEAIRRLRLLQADPQADSQARARVRALIAELEAIKEAQAAALARLMRLRKALAEIEADRKAALAEAALLVGPKPRKRGPARTDKAAVLPLRAKGRVPAYAATIHKSQGSEYPAVIIPAGSTSPSQ